MTSRSEDAGRPLLGASDSPAAAGGSVAIPMRFTTAPPQRSASAQQKQQLGNLRTAWDISAWLLLMGFAALLLAVACGLHYSGAEPVDYKSMDDRCYNGSQLASPAGLPYDACLVRDGAASGSQCGEAAASAFCVLMGANYQVNFTLVDVGGKRGAITLGNGFIGGKLGFSNVCCDAGKYAPPASRWLLLVGGSVALYAVAELAAWLLLLAAELVAVRLLDAAETLYFFLDLQKGLRLLLWSTWLLSWVSWSLWDAWCGPDIDCEDHGSEARANVYRFAQCVFGFCLCYFISKAAPRAISARYFFPREFACIRDLMQKEALLAALVSHVMSDQDPQRRQQRQAAGDPSADAVAELQLGRVGALDSLKTFLAKYQSADPGALREEARVEGVALYERLRGFDLTGDRVVGMDDMLHLFKQVNLSGFKGDEQEAAHLAWAVFDANADDCVTQDEVISALEHVYAQRTNMALTVASNASAVNSLEAVIQFVLFTMMAFICLNIFGLQTQFGQSSSLDFFTTYVLALSFIFGDTVRSVFRSAIYLFAEHPFDVGDYLLIDDDAWRVDSFDLIYTVLKKHDENLFAKVPNDSLMDAQLLNLSRSGPYKDNITVKVPITLPNETFNNLKSKLEAAAGERPKEIVPGSTNTKLQTIDGAHSMVLVVEWVIAFSPGDRERYENVYEAMAWVLKDALLEAGIDQLPMKISGQVPQASAAGAPAAAAAKPAPTPAAPAQEQESAEDANE